MSLPSEGQSLSENQISSTYLNWWLRYNYFRFWKTNVSHIGNLLSISISTICPKSAHYSASGYRISSNHYGNMTSYPFLKTAAATAKYYFRFRICWCHCFQKVKVYQQTKFRRNISIGGWDITTSGFEIQTSAILKFYFRFWSRLFRRNRCVILHPAAEFCPNRNIRRWNMTSYRFSRWRPSAMLYLLLGNGGPLTKCLSWSEFRPQIATSSD